MRPAHLPPMPSALPPAPTPYPVVNSRAKVLALRVDNPWAQASERARSVAVQREIVVSYIRALMESGVSQNNAIALLQERAAGGLLSAHYAHAIKATAKAGRPAPTRSTVCDWCAAYRDAGVAGLLPDHKGRVIESATWWGPALEYFNQPSKPDIAAVHRRIVEVDGIACTYEQVRSYLNSLPAQHGRFSPARIGMKLYRQTERQWLARCTNNLLPGDMYMADGYRADVYLAHPITGDIWRPEVMHVIDIASRCLVGWRVMMHEGAYDVAIGWAQTFEAHNHVPPILYIDNGSGYKNKLTEDSITSYYTRAGVQQIIHSIPHNPKGKGHVERFHRIVKDDFLKLWHPEFYCGDDASADHLNKVVQACKAGRLTPPSLNEFISAFTEWVTRFNRRPHPERANTLRGDVWGQLAPIQPHATACEIARPQKGGVTVARATVRFNNRHYRHPDLHAWNHQKVTIEYDLCNDAQVDIRDASGRLICTATLVAKQAMLPDSHLEQKRQEALAAAEKRQLTKLLETRQRAGIVIDAEAVASAALPDTLYPALEGTAHEPPLHLDLDLE